jgi:hypothetical protein
MEYKPAPSSAYTRPTDCDAAVRIGRHIVGAVEVKISTYAVGINIKRAGVLICGVALLYKVLREQLGTHNTTQGVSERIGLGGRFPLPTGGMYHALRWLQLLWYHHSTGHNL